MSKSEAPFCLISRRVREGAARPGLIYREKPFARDDSGWRIFAGDEEGAFLANPDNTHLVRLEALSALHPDLEPILAARTGSAFERDIEGQWCDVSEEGQADWERAGKRATEIDSHR